MGYPMIQITQAEAEAIEEAAQQAYNGGGDRLDWQKYMLLNNLVDRFWIKYQLVENPYTEEEKTMKHGKRPTSDD